MIQDYLLNLEKELQIYKPLRKDNIIKVIINGHELELYFNKQAILINENGINKHIVPLMLSCSDFFVMTYLKGEYIEKLDTKKPKQLSIFDFI